MVLHLPLSRQKGLSFPLHIFGLWLGQLRLEVFWEFHARVPRA